MSAAQGRFVVFEGLDGAGTTTQSNLLAEHLRARGRTVFLAHQPSEGPVGLLIRQILAVAGINDYVVAPLLTYAALAVSATLLAWLLWFGH